MRLIDADALTAEFMALARGPSSLSESIHMEQAAKIVREAPTVEKPIYSTDKLPEDWTVEGHGVYNDRDAAGAEIINAGEQARDGLSKWGASYYALTNEQLAALIEGKQLVFDVCGEYELFLCYKKTYKGD